MAIIDSNTHGWVVCHETLIRNIYSSTKSDGKNVSYGFNPGLFEILEPFKNNQKDRKGEWESEVKLVKRAYESLRELYLSKKFYRGDASGSNQEAKNIADRFYNGSFDYPANFFLGGNRDEAIVFLVEKEKYIFPKKCIFYSYDIMHIRDHLKNKSFHFILMDPPWWNKFIRRKRKANLNSGYTMLYDSDLLNIPVKYLLDNDGIIGIWCTSAPSHINAILNVLFPAWDIDFISQWFWLKITKQAVPICAFSQSLGKKPYERIIFGIRRNVVRNYPNPENNKVIMSVPSAIHSHKPPVCDLLKPYLPEDANCLEVFARYLLPGWTSYGNEVLKLQHFSLYSETTSIGENSDN